MVQSIIRRLEDFVVVFDNALPHDVCDALIETYEKNPSYHRRYDDPHHKPSFTQFVFTENKHLNAELHKKMEFYLVQHTQGYRYLIPEAKYFPDTFDYEGMRIKCYNNDGNDQFAVHTDATDKEAAKRFLIFLYYLNDVEEGGETVFENIGAKINPTKGTLVLFPPMWLYPHSAKPPISSKKYILSSNLVYR